MGVRDWNQAAEEQWKTLWSALDQTLARNLERGLLGEKGRSGRLIGSVAELLASTVSELVGVGDEPLFRTYPTAPAEPLIVVTACHRLQQNAHGCGLPYGSFHAIRHDFAARMALMFDSATAATLLVHGMQNNTIKRCYTGGVSNYDLTGFRAGEVSAAGSSNCLDQSTYDGRAKHRKLQPHLRPERKRRDHSMKHIDPKLRGIASVTLLKEPEPFRSLANITGKLKLEDGVVAYDCHKNTPGELPCMTDIEHESAIAEYHDLVADRVLDLMADLGVRSFDDLAGRCHGTSDAVGRERWDTRLSHSLIWSQLRLDESIPRRVYSIRKSEHFALIDPLMVRKGDHFAATAKQFSDICHRTAK